MVGSMMVFEAENIEAVRKIVEQDVYYTGGVVRMFLCLSYCERHV